MALNRKLQFGQVGGGRGLFIGRARLEDREPTSQDMDHPSVYDETRGESLLKRL